MRDEREKKVKVVKTLWCPGMPGKKLTVTWPEHEQPLLFVLRGSAEAFCIDDEIPIKLRVTVEEI
jgi:hypothetical protein